MSTRARTLVAALRVAESVVAAAGRATCRRKSVAVLPFANISAAADDEYFADGITEEIINVLVAASRAARRGAHVVLRLQGEERGSARRSASGSACGTCSREACARRAVACASRRSSSTRATAITSGRSATTVS